MQKVLEDNVGGSLSLIFLFVLIQSTEIPGDVFGYRTALKYKIFKTIT